MMRTMSKNNLRNENVSEKVRMENISVHQKEANIYDLIHPELYGNFEQSQIKRDLNLISDLFSPDGNVKVLDVGCGTSNLGTKFLELGYSVKAVNISPGMIDKFRLKLIDGEFSKRVEFMKEPVEYPTACCGDENGQPEGLIEYKHGTQSECACGLRPEISLCMDTEVP
jgi:2-polyprenyl-3-methyl-5-hydroxy-6-metoxy-1,4-benzoquinol methylase